LPNSPRKRAGRRKIKAIIPAAKLARFRDLPTTHSEARFGAGTPDLFLYDDEGRYRFAEVKIDRDRLRATQFRRIAKILRTLGDVNIVHLRESDEVYIAKTYMFNLRRFEGSTRSSNDGIQTTAFGRG